MSETLEALQAQFHQDMVNAYQICIKELHYRPTLVLHYLGEHSAVETACWLVNLPNESSGFTKLWQAGRLELSAEAMILKPEYAPCSRLKIGTQRTTRSKPTNMNFRRVCIAHSASTPPRENEALLSPGVFSVLIPQAAHNERSRLLCHKIQATVAS